MAAAEWVEVQVPEEWVTKGQTRPALVLRTNEEPDPDPERARAGQTVTTYDLTVFQHPEDRQPGQFSTLLRVPQDRVQGAAASASPPAPPPVEEKPNPAPPPRGPTPSGEGRPAFGGLRAGAEEPV